MLHVFVEIIITSIVLILLIGEVITILNIYKLSNPIKSFFQREKLKADELTYEERLFLLRDLELQEKLVEREEQKIANGEMIGSIAECRNRKYLLQNLISKIKTTPLNYHWRGHEIIN